MLTPKILTPQPNFEAVLRNGTAFYRADTRETLRDLADIAFTVDGVIWYCFQILSFGELVKVLRKVERLTQTEFAQKIGVSVSTVSGWENGDAARADTLTKLAAAYGLDCLPMFEMT